MPRLSSLRWSTPKALLVVTPLIVVDAAFLAGNISKIPEGGWFPLAAAVVLLLQITTWRRGRELVAGRTRRGHQPIRDVLNRLDLMERVEGTAVFLFKDVGKAPPP